MIFRCFKKRCFYLDIKCLLVIAALSSALSFACADKVSVKNVHAEETELQVIETEEKKAETHVRTMDEWLSLGVSNAEEGNYTEAKEAFLEAIKLNPDLAEAHFRLGLAYRELGDTGHTVRAFKEAVRIDPDFAEAYYNLGVTYRETGYEQGALQAFKEVIRITPDNAGAHNNLGKLYLGLRLKKEAKAAFVRAIEIKPNLAEAHYGLGSIYVMFNDIGSAFDEYKILIDLDRKLAYQLFKQIYE